MDTERLTDAIEALDVLVVQAQDQAEKWKKLKEEADSKEKFWAIRRDTLKKAKLQVDQIHDDKLIEQAMKR